MRDPIHGNIIFDETAAKIINTPEMQRLRYIKQLDMAYLVFPGANHCRFEHSLGSMAVANEISQRIYGNISEELSYAGLLHDIGHGPFSHLSEFVMKKYLKKSHEQIGEEIIRKSAIGDIINDSGISSGKVIDYFKDSNKVDLVTGPLGSDRIDYLMRDSHYTGVAYGIIDYDRIRTRLASSKGKVAVTEAGISGAESMLIARYFMHSNVYMHHAKLIAARMLQNGITTAIEIGDIDAEQLISMNDAKLIGVLLSSKDGFVADMANRIMERRLFKRAYYEDITDDFDTASLESALENAGIGRNEFVLCLRRFNGGQDDIEVVDSNDNSIGMLTELSPLIKTLTGILASSKKLLVACESKNVIRVNETVRKFLQ